MDQDLLALAQQTRAAAQALGVLDLAQRNGALAAIAAGLEKNKDRIVAANQQDCAAAEKDGIAPALYARLKLGASKLDSAIAGIRDLINLADPLGHLQIHRELDDGLILKRVTCPLGVLGIIFEARPEALIQITSLAIKSGNGVILKGGKEAIQSCSVLTEIIKEALQTTTVSPDAVTLLTTREEIKTLLSLDKYVDLIIPRGSNAFVQYVQQNTNIPVLGHADGICHIYVDQAADLSKAIPIIVDAKTHYPAACNAIETLLIDLAIAGDILPQIAVALQANNVELRGDDETQKFIHVNPASEDDWRTEYSDLTLAIKVVENLEAAIAHINTYGSKHTDGIITEDANAAQKFLNEVNAAGVYHNCSTRFADGFRYGFGAEVGISTQTLPPRGPVGLEGLVTYKYHLVGNGQIAATYTGDQAKSFTHRDLPSER
ncbi:glutamate-5-semialdehyde dehydrogenase [[Leptolyngbya] sp. PCC 7376]|uniref:glutamate-5-semialdehyde dehydrogenase n=1 Tax=[Leptolyngbya] sp. PCC 7376 TaxID=111781 RepID=UPI00029EED1A|nr:glutamate-5-semialdehyde dehydrogenase [[Leptolyngbya] sp. PCC 7376]AFY38910.1 glutamate-5-semialdehyde dehydrogenase [[Leptolyngbya] sp. PCC 7376]